MHYGTNDRSIVTLDQIRDQNLWNIWDSIVKSIRELSLGQINTIVLDYGTDHEILSQCTVRDQDPELVTKERITDAGRNLASVSPGETSGCALSMKMMSSKR